MTTRVLQICLSLDVGGAERVLLDLVKQGPEFGFVNHIAMISGQGSLAAEAEDAGIQVHFLDKKSGFKPGVSWQLARLVKSLQIDLMHAHNIGPGLYAGIASPLCGRPAITTRHGSINRDKHYARKIAGLLCKATVCVGHDVLQKCRDQDGLDPGKLRVIYNGVDFEHLLDLAGPRAQTRSRLGIGSHEPLLISVGRLAPEKNFDLLIEAVSTLRDAKLLLVGDGPTRPALESKIQSLGIKSRIFVLGERHDVPSLLAASDVFVMSSDSEGVSKALLEAMGLGLPVAATAVGGTPEVVIDGLTGLLIPKGDCPALAAAIKRLLSKPGLARAMGDAGRIRAKESFSLSACVASYAKLYREVLQVS